MIYICILLSARNLPCPCFHLTPPRATVSNQQAALRGVQRLTDAGHQVENDEVIRRRWSAFCRYGRGNGWPMLIRWPR